MGEENFTCAILGILKLIVFFPPLDRCFERRGWVDERGSFLVFDGCGLRVFSREYVAALALVYHATYGERAAPQPET